MKITADYRDKQVFANVNFMEEGMPWSKVQGRFHVLYVFEDESFGDELMVALDDNAARSEDDPVYVNKSSVVFENLPSDIGAETLTVEDVINALKRLPKNMRVMRYDTVREIAGEIKSLDDIGLVENVFEKENGFYGIFSDKNPNVLKLVEGKVEKMFVI